MRISFAATSIPKSGYVALFIAEGGKLGPAASALDKAAGGALTHAMKSADFTGKAGALLSVPGPKGLAVTEVAIIGLGKAKDMTVLNVRDAGGTALGRARGKKGAPLTFVVDAVKSSKVGEAELAANLAVGAALSAYRHTAYKTEKLETAMLSVNLEKAGVSALVAGRDMRFSGLNRALDTKRQVGSLVKPAIYLSAFEQNTHNLGTLLDDGPLEVKDSSGDVWTPENFDHKFRGEMPLYEAFSKSINIPAVNLGLDIGVHKVAETLNQLGIQQQVEQYPSLLLGALELSSFDVAQMYSTIARQGRYQPLSSIAAMTNSVGRVLYEHRTRSEQRFAEESIYMTNYGLKRVTKDGTAKRINLHYPSIQLAGKTGTSNDLRDSWFAGFDHNTVTVTWLGRDDNKPTGLTGSSGALELYIRYLKPLNPQAIADQRPDGVRWAFVNPKTGRQAAPSCGKVIQLPIRREMFNPAPTCS